MPKMPRAGKDHGDAVLVGGLDHLFVAHRPAGLDHRGRAGLDGDEEAVGEREEGVGGDHRSLGRGSSRPAACAASAALRAAMRAESTRLICPAPMPTVARILGVDDRIRFDVLGDAEGEAQVAQFGVARRASGHRLQLHVIDHGVVARLHQEAAGDGLCGQARRARIGQSAGEQQPQVLLGADDGDRLPRSRPAR